MKAVLFVALVLGAWAEPRLSDYRQPYYPERWSPLERPELPSANPDDKYIRGCYFTNWAQYRPGEGKYLPDNYVTGLCTHIFYAFGWMNEDFTMRAFDPADVDSSWAKGMYGRVNALKKSDPELKTLLSVGGWTFGTRLFKAMSKTSDSRAIFIDSAMKFVRQHQFDGLDIDWEYPAGQEDVRNYVALIAELRSAFEEEAKRLNRPRLLLTAAVSAGESTIKNGFDIPAVAPNFDFILLMSYDFHGAWEEGTGMNSPLYAREGQEPKWQVWNVDWAARFWHEQGMPKEKIVVGMATYGRGWTLKEADPKAGLKAPTKGPAKATKYVREAGVASYYELCQMLGDGATRHWHPEHQVPWLVYGDQWFGYDDEQSIRNKMQWLKKNGYGGAFVWTLDFDDFTGRCPGGGGKKYPLINVIKDELTGVAPPPTTTTIKVTPRSSTKMTTAVTSGASTKLTVRTTRVPMTPPTFTAGTTMGKTTQVPSSLCLGLGNGFHPLLSRPGPSDSLLGDCGKFLLCVEGQSYRMACPAGLEYDADAGYCRSFADSLCHSLTTKPVYTKTTAAPATTMPPVVTMATTAPPTNGTETFQCPEAGFFASKVCCGRFYRCVEFGGGEGLRGFPFSCPVPLHFDEAMRVCVHPTASDCHQLPSANCL